MGPSRAAIRRRSHCCGGSARHRVPNEGGRSPHSVERGSVTSAANAAPRSDLALGGAGGNLRDAALRHGGVVSEDLDRLVPRRRQRAHLRGASQSRARGWGSRLLAGCGVRRARPSLAGQIVCFGCLSRSLLLMAVRSRQRGGPCDAQLERAKVARFKGRDGDVLVVDEVSSSPRAIRTASFSSGDSRAARGPILWACPPDVARSSGRQLRVTGRDPKPGIGARRESAHADLRGVRLDGGSRSCRRSRLGSCTASRSDSVAAMRRSSQARS